MDCALASPPGAAIKVARGRLAQLVERLLYTQDVGGSSPSPPTSLHTRSAEAASTAGTRLRRVGYAASRRPVRSDHRRRRTTRSFRRLSSIYVAARYTASLSSLAGRNATFLLALI